MTDHSEPPIDIHDHSAHPHDHAPHAHEAPPAPVTPVAKSGRQWYKFATHSVDEASKEVKFSSPRALAFGAGAIVVAGGAYMLTRPKAAAVEQDNWQERTASPAEAAPAQAR